MEPEKILYTDGHKVMVTDSFFKVKKSFYLLRGITKHGFSIIHPDRRLPLIAVMLGVAMIAFGAMDWVPNGIGPTLEFYWIQLNPDTETMGLGILLFGLGAFLLVLMKDRYAIRIATAEGERNVVVSRKREYINQIMDVLNHAFIDLTTTHQHRPNRLERK